jgi:hypothetical protein
LWPIQLPFLRYIPRTALLSSLTLCNTSSFLTWPVQLIFSIILQHPISRHSRYFWPTDNVIKFNRTANRHH